MKKRETSFLSFFMPRFGVFLLDFCQNDDFLPNWKKVFEQVIARVAEVLLKKFC
ncbi:hypothetical protein [Emergencia sp.]|uniref:hypothetical protein n=1 Tax=Emergencia sp. TaxID=1926557 RepID=UPI003AF1CA77